VLQKNSALLDYVLNVLAVPRPAFFNGRIELQQILRTRKADHVTTGQTGHGGFAHGILANRLLLARKSECVSSNDVVYVLLTEGV
jgi:hypothetical protein